MPNPSGRLVQTPPGDRLGPFAPVVVIRDTLMLYARTLASGASWRGRWHGCVFSTAVPSPAPLPPSADHAQSDEGEEEG
jgi:hypothetical protein